MAGAFVAVGGGAVGQDGFGVPERSEEGLFEDREAEYPSPFEDSDGGLDGGGDDGRRNPYKPIPSLQVRSTTVLPADVGETGGEVTAQRLDLGVGLLVPISEVTRLRLSIDHEGSFYNFSGTAGLTPGSDDPVDYVASTNFGALLLTQFNEEVGLVAGGSFGFAGEIGAEFNDSIRGRAFVAPTFQLSEKLNLGAGVAVQTRLEDDPIIVPFLQVRYQASDRWLVQTQGPGVEATYDLNEQVDLRGGVGFSYRQYRLDGGGGAIDDGVFLDVSLDIGAGLDWKVAPNVDIGFDVTLIPYREIEFQQRNGTRVSVFDADPTVAFGLGVTARF